MMLKVTYLIDGSVASQRQVQHLSVSYADHLGMHAPSSFNVHGQHVQSSSQPLCLL